VDMPDELDLERIWEAAIAQDARISHCAVLAPPAWTARAQPNLHGSNAFNVFLEWSASSSDAPHIRVSYSASSECAAKESEPTDGDGLIEHRTLISRQTEPRPGFRFVRLTSEVVVSRLAFLAEGSQLTVAGPTLPNSKDQCPILFTVSPSHHYQPGMEPVFRRATH
jgi:hypothetical protein